MRRSLVTALAVVPLPILQLVGDVTPDPDRPRSALVQLGLTLNKESGSTADRIRWTLPKAIRVSGRGFPRCSTTQAARRACPRGSLVGTGRLSTVVPPEMTPLVYEMTVFASGARRFTVALRSPERRLERSAFLRGRTLTLAIPSRVRAPAPRTFAYLTNATLALGPAETASGRPVARLGRCTGPRHDYGVELRFTGNPKAPQQRSASVAAQSPCRR